MALGARKLAAEALIAKSGRGTRRHTPVCIEWLLDGKDMPLCSFGGRWDSVESEYDRPAETAVPISLHGAQANAARWFVSWLIRHIDYRRLVQSGETQRSGYELVYGDSERVMRALLYGGRGSGKTYLASSCAAAYAVAIPKSRVVILCPFIDHTIEVRDALLGKNLATEWREYHATDNRIDLVNGSRIELLTARGKTEMKIGSADLVIINEAQEIPQQLTDDLLRLDTGGVQVLTCNPPRSQKGAWLMKWHEEMLRGERPESRHFFLDPRRNPHIPPDTFTQAHRLLGSTRYRREYLGDMAAPLTDVVFEGYTDDVNKLEYVPTSWRDVTAIVAERHYQAPGAEWVLGLDFDQYTGSKGCTWSASRFYEMPSGAVCQVIEMAESLIPGEIKLGARLHEVERHGYRCFSPETTVLVCDASAQHQNNERDWEKPTSWERLEKMGWEILRRPDAELATNPPVWLRMSLCDFLLRDIPGKGGREPLIYVLPQAQCVRDSMRFYPKKKNGEPNRRSEHAHPADTWSYVAWRKWGHERDIIELLAAERARKGPEFMARPSYNL